eukprot:scaffold121041_cov32-Prasinocladus_malaysianus.AAC.1
MTRPTIAKKGTILMKALGLHSFVNGIRHLVGYFSTLLNDRARSNYGPQKVCIQVESWCDCSNKWPRCGCRFSIVEADDIYSAAAVAASDNEASKSSAVVPSSALDSLLCKRGSPAMFKKDTDLAARCVYKCNVLPILPDSVSVRPRSTLP